MDYIYEAEGKNRQEAEAEAVQFLEVKPEDLTFKPLSASKGILGFVSRKPTVIRVSPAKENFPVEAMIKGTLITLLRKMGIDAVVENIGDSGENILVELESDDSGVLIGKQGRTLDALQFILNLMISPSLRGGKRIMIDVADYRERRHRRISRMAKSMADRVSKTHQSILLEYMNPYERRIVHLALENDSRVYTKSDGNGIYKRVRIFPALDTADASNNENFSDEDEEVDGNRKLPEHEENDFQ